MAQTINNINFREATRQQAKASIVIEGLSGMGKSGLALILGYVLSHKKWEAVYATDTENKSLDLFQGIGTHTGETFGAFKKFDLTTMHGYSPSNYLAIKEAAKKNGAQALIQDSISHMWQGAGGILGLVADAKAKDPKLDNYRVWGLDSIKSEKDKVVDTIRDSELHIISTVRVKEKQEMVLEDGKNKLKSLGEQQIQMPDLKYEPDLVLSMTRPGTPLGVPPKALVVKSRYAILEKDTEYEFTIPLMEQLRAYLEEGADPAELREQQRLEIIQLITDILNSKPTSATMFPLLKENLGVKDKKLADLDLPMLKTLYTTLVS